MNTYTTIGYFNSSPHEPLCFVVQAADVGGAIRAAEREALNLDSKVHTQDTFINTFVFAGEPELLSTWAG